LVAEVELLPFEGALDSAVVPVYPLEVIVLVVLLAPPMQLKLLKLSSVCEVLMPEEGSRSDFVLLDGSSIERAID
jgi:hypothetical protein